jgi:hypothetical protein
VKKFQQIVVLQSLLLYIWIMISKYKEIFIGIDTSPRIAAYFIAVREALNGVYLFQQVLKLDK